MYHLPLDLSIFLLCQRSRRWTRSFANHHRWRGAHQVLLAVADQGFVGMGLLAGFRNIVESDVKSIGGCFVLRDYPRRQPVISRTPQFPSSRLRVGGERHDGKS